MITDYYPINESVYNQTNPMTNLMSNEINTTMNNNTIDRSRNLLESILDQEQQNSQYFIKFEILPIPNQQTITEIYKKQKFGTITFVVLGIMSLISICVVSTHAPKEGINLLITQFLFCVIYIIIINNTALKLNEYDKVSSNNFDKSVQLMKIFNVWLYYAAVCTFDIFGYFLSINGILLLIIYNEEFSKYKNMITFISIISIFELLYFSTIKNI